MTAQLPLNQVDTPRSYNVPTFIKWAGGKASLLPQYASLFPDPLPQRYFEPFLGSGAVFFFLRPTQALLSDYNQDLVDLFKVVKEHPQDLMAVLRQHANNYDGEKYYYHLRSLSPSKLPLVERAARFVFLNKVGFNGLYRENSRGEFNVPWGRYERIPKLFNEKDIWEASQSLQSATLKWAPYQDIIELIDKGDFAYFDPPYAPISPTSSFTSYTSSGFDEDDQRKLADAIRRLHRRGVKVMVSNSDTPIIHKFYAGFDVRRVMARRRINSNGSGRAPISELLIRNYK